MQKPKIALYRADSCGVCLVAHHIASAKAVDAAFNTEPPETAKKLRELEYCGGHVIYDHILHFYFLGGPDFVVEFDAPPIKRNILGVIEKVDLDVGKEVINTNLCSLNYKRCSMTRRIELKPPTSWLRRWTSPN